MSRITSHFLQSLSCILIAACYVGNCQQLRADDVSEGQCVPNLSQKGSRNVNFLWFGQSRNYYVPIASEACYRGYAEVLLGRPAVSQAELDSMKLRIDGIFPFPPTFVTYGFPNETSNQGTRQVKQICPPTALNQILCLPVMKRSTRGTDTSSISTSLDTVYYTDNESTILIVRCLNQKVKDYKVLTTGPVVSNEIRETLVQKIEELGFDPTLMRTTSY